MNRIVIVTLLVIVAFGAIWYSNHGDKIQIGKFLSAIGWDKSAHADDDPNAFLPVSFDSENKNHGLRIASFNLDGLDQTRFNQPHVAQRIAQIFRNFDLIAVQGIRSNQAQLQTGLIDKINQLGLRYTFAVSSVRPSGNQQTELGFVYNRSLIATNRQSIYTLDDPDNLFRVDPLIGSFRVRGIKSEKAFTFTLVNVHVDSENAKQELDLLPQVYRIVRNSAAGEDDIILLGDFFAGDRELRPLSKHANLEKVISKTATSTNGEYQFDNLLYYRPATTELTGRSGVYDFLKEQNLSMDQALQISSHMPVWAEFTPFEGGNEY